ncbi:primosomal protein N' family DNA-binding protein, partial [Komagataeibacter kakiaceti]
MPHRNPSQTELLPTPTGRRVRVMLTLPFAGPLDYPPGRPGWADAGPGDIVTVPLGRRTETGVIWDETPHLPPEFMPPPQREVAASRLKPVTAHPD